MSNFCNVTKRCQMSPTGIHYRNNCNVTNVTNSPYQHREANRYSGILSLRVFIHILQPRNNLVFRFQGGSVWCIFNVLNNQRFFRFQIWPAALTLFMHSVVYRFTLWPTGALIVKLEEPIIWRILSAISGFSDSRFGLLNLLFNSGNTQWFTDFRHGPRVWINYNPTRYHKWFLRFKIWPTMLV